MEKISDTSGDYYICRDCNMRVSWFASHDCKNIYGGARALPHNPIPIIPPKKYEKDTMLELITAFIEVRNSFAALRMNMKYMSEQMEEFKKVLDEVTFT